MTPVHPPIDAVGQLISGRRDEIVARWARCVRERCGLGDLGRLQLVDALPRFLDELSATLRGLADGGGPERAAGEHEGKREEAGANVESLLCEYAVLREVVLDVIEESGCRFGVREARAFEAVLASAVSRSVVEFVGRRERSLSETAQRLDAVLRTAVDGIIGIDEFGAILHVNPAASRIFGYSEEELVGHNVKMLMPEPYHSEHDGYLENYRRTGVRRIIGIGREVRGLRRDGTVFPLELGVSETTTSAGRVFIGLVRDITDRKRAEEQRDESLSLLDAVVSAAPVGLAFVDRELRLVRVNDALARVHGESPEAAIGRTFHEVMPEIAPALEAHARRVFDTLEPDLGLELAGRTRGGEPVHWLVGFYPVTRRRGDVLLVGSVFVDITERKRAEEAMAQVDALVAAAPVGVALFDPDMRYVRVNEALARANGREIGAHLGRRVSEVLPEGGAELEALIRSVLETGEPLHAKRMPVALPGDAGNVHHFQLDMFPVRSSGRLLGAAAVVVDLTEQVRTIEALDRALQERARALEVLEQGDACFVLDHDFRIRLVTRRQEELSQTRREQTLGRVFWEVFPSSADPASTYWREYHRAMRERVEVHFEEHYAPLDVWTDVRVYPLLDGGIAVFFHDASERKRLEQFQQHLIGIVSHDLRTPLTALRLTAQRLSRLELPDQAKTGVARVLAAEERLSRIVMQLLDYTRARSGGGIRLSRRHVDLCALAARVVDEFALSNPGRVKVACASERIVGEWDPDRLAQVVSNLVANALRHGARDAPIEVAVRRDAGEAVVAVSNRGAPIPPAMLPRLFDPFKRGLARDAEGLGLGLYIVQEIVKAHGGRVEATSTLAQGTTFRVSLPVARHEAAGEAAPG